MVTLLLGNRRLDLDFDTLKSAPVAEWRVRAPEGAPRRTLEQRLVAN